jgi:tellurium resistance protein TerD
MEEIKMAVNLTKGGNVNLSKNNPGMTKVCMGLGWDANSRDGSDFDLDASVFLLGSNGKIASGDERNFVFYNNLTDPSGAVEHTGDNRTGAGDGDDEMIKVDLQQIPASVVKVVFVVTIDEATERNQNFGQVNNAFIRLVDESTGDEKYRYDLTEDFSTETALCFAELYRNNDDWKFRATGTGYGGGLAKFCDEYGVAH